MTRFPKTKQPLNARVLDTWIRDRAEGSDELKNRLRRGVSYMIVSAVLGELREEDGTPLFILKGGVAMQLRFGIRARFSRDYDAAFRREIGHLEAALADAPNHPVGGFALRAVGKPEPLGPTGAFRQKLKITYGLKPWGEVQLEVSRPEGGSADLDSLDLLAPDPDPTVFGLGSVPLIPCMSVAYQVAQKLHASTEVREHEPNNRFHDLLDLQLLSELIGDGDWARVREACIDTFTLRSKHSWPPTVQVYPEWPEAYERMAKENAFPVTDVHEAAAKVQAIIDRTDAATS